MTVNEWFSAGCKYKQGVAIYEKLPNANKNFVRNFKRKESMQNLMKLKYELQKKLQPTAITSIIKKPPPAPTRKIHINIDSSPKTVMPQSESRYYRKVLLNQLPVELHPIYIQQKNDFITYCSLKIQLGKMAHQTNSLGNPVIGRDGLPKLKQQTPVDIEVATKLCLQIENLWDAIDKAWQIIDHFLDTKEVVLLQEKNFSELKGSNLFNKIISVRGSITRQKTRQKMLSEKLQNAVAKKYKIKYQRDLTKCTAKLMQLEQDKIQLLKIRDNE